MVGSAWVSGVGSGWVKKETTVAVGATGVDGSAPQAVKPTRISSSGPSKSRNNFITIILTANGSAFYLF
jgi:hypothetical protein